MMIEQTMFLQQILMLLQLTLNWMRSSYLFSKIPCPRADVKFFFRVGSLAMLVSP